MNAIYDTGANISVIDSSLLKKIKVKMEKSKGTKKIAMADGSASTIVGRAKINCSIGSMTKPISFLVMKKMRYEIIIGLDTIIAFDLEQKKNEVWRGEERISNEVRVSEREERESVCVADINNNIAELQQTIDKYATVFEGLGMNTRTSHVIKLTGDKIVRQKERQIPLPLLEGVKKQIEFMGKEKIIAKSNSNFRSNIVAVPKEDNSVRVTIDFRELNKIIESDSFPLPKIENILTRLRDAKYFTKLDLVKGYFQIPLAEDSQKYTAFAFNRQLYEFKRMPMGLKTAPQTFQRLMEDIFAEIPFVDFYLDDLIIFSKTEEEHIRHVETILKMMKEENLKLNKAKCVFGANSIEYLGFKIEHNTRTTTSHNKQQLLKFPRPRNQKEVKTFVASANYYRKLIKEFAHTAKPLHDCMNAKKFEWKAQQDESFAKLKEMIAAEPRVAIPDTNAKFIVTTDASDIGMGGTLEQLVDGQREIIEFYSKAFNKCQQRYSTYEKEATAIVSAIEHWKHFLMGRPFRVETDHKPLCWLLSKRDCLGKLGRMVDRLDEYQIENIAHIKGKDNEIADTLSRMQINLLTSMSQDEEALINMSRRDPVNFERIGGKLFFVDNCSTLGRRIHRLCITNDEDKQRILNECHNEMGHFGVFKCSEHVRKRFFWPGWKKYVTRYVRNCSRCAQYKTDFEVNRLPMVINDSTQYKNWEVIGLDIVGPLTPTDDGNKYIVVAQDYASKFLLTKAMPTVTSRSLSDWLETIFNRFERPKRIITDNGTQMNSTAFKQWTSQHNIDLAFITPFHHQSNGMVERVNRTIEDMLRTSITRQALWDSELPRITDAYNAMTHYSTGLAPYKIIFGEEKLSSLDRRLGVQQESDRSEHLDIIRKENIKASSSQQKIQYDKHRRPTCLQPGQLVLWHVEEITRGGSRKLNKKWRGPFVLARVTQPNGLIVDAADQVKWIHLNHLKPFPGNAENLDTIRSRGRPRNIPGTGREV